MGEGWTKDLDRLQGLRAFAGDAAFQDAVDPGQARQQGGPGGLGSGTPRARTCDPAFLFDVQVKRIHEYKRQLLNLLHVAALWNRAPGRRRSPGSPRAVMLGGKAAPGLLGGQADHPARQCALAAAINADPQGKGRLRPPSCPTTGSSLAELVFPASELSEQISTAGTEASGTGNMKAALNGALTIGTLDGANVEIRDEVGEDNIFIFGHTAHEIVALRDRGYRPRDWAGADPELAAAIETIARLEGGKFQAIAGILLDSDHYCHCADFASYLETQSRVATVYARPREWARRSILNVAGMGRFSIDRTVRDYAGAIWNAEPVHVEPVLPE